MPDEDPKKPKLGLRGEIGAVRLLCTEAWRVAPLLTTATFGHVIAISATNLAMNLAAKEVLDAVAAGNYRGATVGSLVFAACAAATAGLNAIDVVIDQPLKERVRHAIEAHLIELAAAPPGLEHHERPDHQDRLQLLRERSWQFSHALGQVSSFLLMFLNLFITLGVLFSVHPALTLLIAPAALSRFWASKIVRLNTEAEEAVAEPNRRASHLYWLCTSAAPGKELRVFGLGPEIVRRQQRLRREVDDTLDRTNRLTSLLGALASIPSNAGFVCAFAFTLQLAIAGTVSVGDVFLVIVQAGTVGAYLDAVTQRMRFLTQSLVTVDGYRWLLDYVAQTTVPAAEPASVPARLTDGVRLENVTFRYHGGETDVLQGVDLHLPAGSTVAIVGDNGAGKTTLVKLLCRMYQPTAGRITVDGVDLARMDPAAWRDHITAAFQDHTRWELLAREVIGIGDLQKVEDVDAVRRALAAAGAADLEGELEEGFETPLGRSMKGGRELSGGQWQKLALARALMREDPLLVILDEPTSALDPSAEHALFERYAEITARSRNGAITLLVSHRFSTVRMADLIIVVSDGRIAESGTHADLLALGGLYAELYELQARSYR